MSACSMVVHVDDHFRGVVAIDREREMRAHLATCDACRKRYTRRALLAKLDPAAPSAEDRIGRALGIARVAKKPSVLRLLPEASLVLALAACVLIFFRPPAASDGFSARGAVDPMTGVAPREARVSIYRVPAGSDRPVRAGDTIHDGDELAFAYENPTGKPYLMIFAVDEKDRVYWFHPAWTDAAADPVAIPAENGPSVHELREAVRHRFAGTRIDIHAVFLDKPLTVRQMEAEIQVAPHVPEGVDRVETLTILR